LIPLPASSADAVPAGWLVGLRESPRRFASRGLPATLAQNCQLWAICSRDHDAVDAL
jgi:hypothetical protein